MAAVAMAIGCGGAAASAVAVENQEPQTAAPACQPHREALVRRLVPGGTLHESRDRLMVLGDGRYRAFAAELSTPRDDDPRGLVAAVTAATGVEPLIDAGDPEHGVPAELVAQWREADTIYGVRLRHLELADRRFVDAEVWCAIDAATTPMSLAEVVRQLPRLEPGWVPAAIARELQTPRIREASVTGREHDTLVELSIDGDEVWAERIYAALDDGPDGWVALNGRPGAYTLELVRRRRRASVTAP